MGWQTIVTAVLVAGCSMVALWSLLPGALRQRCRMAFGGAAAPAAGACGGCGGCESAAAGGKAQAAVIHVVRRPPTA